VLEVRDDEFTLSAAGELDVLANDSWSGRGSLELVSAEASSGAAVVRSGAVRYEPGEAVGQVEVHYLVRAPSGEEARGTARVLVLGPLVTAPDAASALTQTEVRVAVLANDEPGLELVSVKGTGGAWSIQGSEVVLAPSGPGTVNASYTARAADGRSATQRVEVNVREPSAPVARPDRLEVLERTSGTADVLANDTSEVGGLEVTSVSASTGRAELERGRVRFTPPNGFTGEVEVAYEVRDARGQSASSVLVVSVLDAPETTAVADSVSVAAGAEVRVAVLANDTSFDGSEVVLVSARNGKLGSTEVTGAAVLYRAGDEPGTDTFTYKVRDRLGQVVTGTVTVTVGPAARQG
jgi:hypothetical protein